jgi:homoserine kinase
LTTATATAPASSANLGPGYDVLALALDLRCRVTVATASSWAVLSAGAAADVEGAGLVTRAAQAVAPELGPLRVDVESEIPVGRGLGSSAALIAATAGAALRLAGGEPSAAGLLPAAAAVEGHPDNVAASLLGGLVAVGAAGEVRSLEMHPSLEVLVAVPDARLATTAARAVTAGPVETGLAARTAARVVMLVEGLRTADPAALAAAAGDEIHESRRAHLSPVTGELIRAARRAGALHVCWSGAGPAVLAVVTRPVADAVRRSMAETLGQGYVLSPGIDRAGLLVG